MSETEPPLLKMAPPDALPPLPPLPPLPLSCTMPSPPSLPVAELTDNTQLLSTSMPPLLKMAPPLPLKPAAPLVPLGPASWPAVNERFLRVKWLSGFTVKRRTAFPPLKVAFAPAASRKVLVAMVTVSVKVTVPTVEPQSKPTTPPPLSASRRLGKSHDVTNTSKVFGSF